MALSLTSVVKGEQDFRTRGRRHSESRRAASRSQRPGIVFADSESNWSKAHTEYDAPHSIVSTTLSQEPQLSMSLGKQTNYSREEVTKHNREGDLWVIIDSQVYDLSRFAQLHPGGTGVLLNPEVAGQDATETFFGLHRFEVLEKPNYARLRIGSIINEKPRLHGQKAGTLSDVPYAEPVWLTEGFYSPYYTENHRRFQAAVRTFVDEYIYPDAQAREVDGKLVTSSVIAAMADINMHAMRMGPGKHLKGLTLMRGLVKPEEFDYFHELIISQEIMRHGRRGYMDALFSGNVIGLPPILNFGSPKIKERVVPGIFAGKKFACLAISEAFAGSDVTGIQTTAKKTKDGKYWIVNGTKKWITNGTFADYFTVGCKTDNGFTVILVERGGGVETKPIKTAYSPSAGTAFITFDNVKVPIGNTLGKEGNGIFVILSNFNHERWVMCTAIIQNHRNVLDECLKWVNQRKVFGKPLSSQPVIRSKLAQMISRIESAQAWLENVTYQMCNMSYEEQSAKLAGQIAFLKMFCTQSAQASAADATQIFGGRGITKTGMGNMIELYHRTVPFDAILGGAEDVLGDLGVRQALRAFPSNVRL